MLLSSTRVPRTDTKYMIGGPANLQSLANLPQAEQIRAKDAQRRSDASASRPGMRPRGKDELVVSPDSVEAIESARNLKGNADEESHQDRREHSAYTPGGRRNADAQAQRRLDVNG